MHTTTPDTLYFVWKGEKKNLNNKVILVTNLFTHANNIVLYFLDLCPMQLEELALEVLKEETLRISSKISYTQDKLCPKFY